MASILGALLAPSGLAYSLFVLGLLICFKAQWRRLSWGLLAAAGAINVVCSSGMVAAALLGPLEYEYPAVHDARSRPDVKHIVVLTGYASDDPNMPVTGRLNPSSAFRVMLALQLQRQCAACDVIVSGGPETTKVTGDALLALGLPQDRLVLETASKNTAASALNLRPLLNQPFFLVTSGGHLRRSLAVLEKQGLQPIPAPTDYQGPKDWRTGELRPSPLSLFATDLAVHEYIGRLWYGLKGEL